jgi:hypothetical protein
MCGGAVWEFDPWRPFISLIDDLTPTQQNERSTEGMSEK